MHIEEDHRQLYNHIFIKSKTWKWKNFVIFFTLIWQNKTNCSVLCYQVPPKSSYSVVLKWPTVIMCNESCCHERYLERHAHCDVMYHWCITGLHNRRIQCCSCNDKKWTAVEQNIYMSAKYEMVNLACKFLLESLTWHITYVISKILH